MKLNEIRIDAAKADQGAWVGEIPDMGNIRLKVRGIGNSDYRRRMARLVDALPRQHKAGGRIDPDEQDKINMTCLLDDVLLDWDGIEGDDGQPLPYSRDQAKALLTDPDMKRFRDAVVWAATVVQEQDAETAKVNAGN